jgi:hypothetical protein
MRKGIITINLEKTPFFEGEISAKELQEIIKDIRTAVPVHLSMIITKDN